MWAPEHPQLWGALSAGWKTGPGSSTRPQSQHQGQGMLCSASHVHQGLCNTLSAWHLASEMASPVQLWAPEGRARSWKHLQAAGSCTLWHMPSAVGCPDPTNTVIPLHPFLCSCPSAYRTGHVFAQKQVTGWKDPAWLIARLSHTFPLWTLCPRRKS